MSHFVRAVAPSLLLILSACGGSSPLAPPAPALPAPAPTAAPEATYRVTFDATWSAATHAVPANPHFSPLIGGTHGPGVRFWQPGAIASDGIEAMAERGNPSPLDAEIRTAIEAGSAQTLIQGDGTPSPGRVSVTFRVTRDLPLVTLVTMVAPTPDWFVGVESLSLIENGQWVNEKVVPLVPWDAGTDSGRDFLSPDRDSQPRQPIAPIGSPPLGAAGAALPLGTFTFSRM